MDFTQYTLPTQLHVMSIELKNTGLLRDKATMWNNALTQVVEARGSLEGANAALTPQWTDGRGALFLRDADEALSIMNQWQTNIETAAPHTKLGELAGAVETTYGIVKQNHDRMVQLLEARAGLQTQLTEASQGWYNPYTGGSLGGGDTVNLSNQINGIDAELMALQIAGGKAMNDLAGLYRLTAGALNAASAAYPVPDLARESGGVAGLPAGGAGAGATAMSGGAALPGGGAGAGAAALSGGTALPGGGAALPGGALVPAPVDAALGTAVPDGQGLPDGAALPGGAGTSGAGGAGVPGAGGAALPAGLGGVAGSGASAMPSLSGLAGTLTPNVSPGFSPGVAPSLPPLTGGATLPGTSMPGVPPFVPPIFTPGSAPGGRAGGIGAGAIGAGGRAGGFSVPGVSLGGTGGGSTTLPQAAAPITTTASGGIGAPLVGQPAGQPGLAATPAVPGGVGAGVPPMMPPMMGGAGPGGTGGGRPGSGAVKRPTAVRKPGSVLPPGLPPLLSGKAGKTDQRVLPVRTRPSKVGRQAEPQVAAEAVVDEDLWRVPDGTGRARVDRRA